MENNIGLAFLSFDLKKGPVIPFSNNLTDNFCEKMALRVLFTGVAGDKSKNADSFYGESIIPFPDDDKIVFSYLFPILSTGNGQIEPRASAITIVFPQNQQKFLYSVATDITSQLKLITRRIQEEIKNSGTISYQTTLELNKLCDFDYLSNINTISDKQLDKFVPEIESTESSKVTKSSIGSESDIPKVTSSAYTLFTKSSDTYNELTNTFGNKFFNLISSIDGKKSVYEISKKSNIEIMEVSNFINTLVKKGFIKIYSEPVKLTIVFEYFYNIICESIKNNMGDMGVKIIKNALKEMEKFYFAVSYEVDNTISFEKLVSAVETGQFTEEELIFEFSKPINKVLEEIEKKNGPNYTKRFITARIKNLEEKYGSSIKNILKFSSITP